MAEPAASASAPARAMSPVSIVPMPSIAASAAASANASASGAPAPVAPLLGSATSALALPAPVDVAGATPDAIVAALANSGPTRLLAVQSNLAAADATRLEAKLAELHQRAGGRAYLVLVPASVDVEHYAIAPLYERLGLARRDVLILANGTSRHLRTAGLPKEAGGEILKATREAYRRSPTDGLVAVLDELERRFAAAAPAAPGTPAGSVAPPAGTTGQPANIPLPILLLGAMLLALVVMTLLRGRRSSGKSGRAGRRG
jgi:hypothetical protein